MQPYAVAVRTLCDFGARRGDLDRRYAPSPTAREGQEGHAAVAARRSGGYEAEVTLATTFGPLQVRGRADGYDPAGPRVDEVKTFRGPLERMPENQRHLHWAQAKVYGWLLCERDALQEIEVALVYLDVDRRGETVLTQRRTAGELRQHFERLCAVFLGWAEQEVAHRAARDAALAALAFPHAGFRRGQRALAEAVYKAGRAGRCLLAQAPTGIGKTVGTLFPLLKAVVPGRLDRVYFLTAKTSGRALAMSALASLRAGAPALPLRALELVAREQACEHPDRACHGESCPLARGFHDRLPAARAAATALPAWDRDAVRMLARQHDVCPYYLAQELAHWTDVVVGDYNHYFDASALLHGLALANEWRVGLLVDEAHNLVERGRTMYSGALDQAALGELRRAAPPALRKPLDRVHRQWNALNRLHASEYAVLDAPPARLLAALQGAVAAIADHLAQHPDDAQGVLADLYFDALHVLRLAESFDAQHSLFDLQKRGRASVLCVRNVVPASFLRPRLAAACAATLFSATLQPPDYYRQMLGLPDEAPWTDIDAPFEPAQLEVRIARRIDTRMRQRAATLDRVVDLIARQYDERPGNYLAFFSSYDYLAQAVQRLAQRHPALPFWCQARGMSEAEQSAFLARFEAAGRGVGFAVLGGSFGEAVDLPGDRLVGAFVATLGMPAFSEVNEQMRRCIDRLCGRGYEYMYLYPGLRKVVQAAGRVIRTVEDRGVVHLIDARFAQREVRALLPAWWRVQMER